MIDGVEELNPNEPTEPRPAASVILLRRGKRHGSQGLQVLLGKRTQAARFMPNVWVFPGGAVDPDAVERRPDDTAYRMTALRELEEEASVTLEDVSKLVPFSRWITPLEVKVRFDTRFYLAVAPPHAAPTPDGNEIVELGWFAPAEALRRHAEGEMLLVFPTIKQLEALTSFTTADEAIDAARSQTIEPIMPRVVARDGRPLILMPSDPDYED